MNRPGARKLGDSGGAVWLVDDVLPAVSDAGRAGTLKPCTARRPLRDRLVPAHAPD
jgi:hypothetical protein